MRFLLILLSGLLPLQLYAQSSILLDIPELPEGTSPIPEPGGGEPVGVLINHYNAQQYKKIIPQEIYALIRSASLSVDAARRVKYEWRLDDAWEKKSEELRTANVNLEKGDLQTLKFPIERGFPFGTGKAVEALWMEAQADDQESNKKALDPSLAYKILWNVQSQFWGFGFFDLLFDIKWLKEGKPFRSAAGRLLRAYPAALSLEHKSEQLFRELIEFSAPSTIQWYSWLTFRFKGMDEDMVWTYSPASKKVRQLTASNRADALITSSVAADDLLGWSGKIAMIEATLESKTVGLVPFPELEMAALQDRPNSCAEVVSIGDSWADKVPAHWNFETARFPGEAAWLPTRAVFAPRKLWRIELSSRDPYSLYGRQVLYVDAVMQLPVYKIVYDRAGRPFKTIIQSYGLAATKDRSRKAPYPAFAIILDHTKDTSFVIDYRKVMYCMAYPNEYPLERFAPAKIGEPQPVAIAAKAE